MAAAIGGVRVLVFTGGVGERSAEVREAAAAGLAFLGVALDHDANAGAEPDCEIGAPDAAVHTLVVHAREDIELARGARELLERPDRRPDQGVTRVRSPAPEP